MDIALTTQTGSCMMFVGGSHMTKTIRPTCISEKAWARMDSKERRAQVAAIEAFKVAYRGAR